LEVWYQNYNLWLFLFIPHVLQKILIYLLPGYLEIKIQKLIFVDIFDFDDWGVDIRIFHFFNSVWGPFTCDAFASANNFKVKNFYSQFWTPGCSGVDVFTFDWSKDLNWFVPPIHLICKAISHIIYCKAKGTMIVPEWKSAVFWPLIIDTSGKFEWFIKDCVEYKNPSIFFVTGSDKNSIFSESTFNSNVLVLKIDAEL
jgi:hypothetical protein